MTWPMEECDHIKAMRKWLKTHGKLTDIEADMTLEEISTALYREKALILMREYLSDINRLTLWYRPWMEIAFSGYLRIILDKNNKLNKRKGKRVSTQRVEQSLLCALHKFVLALDAENARLKDHLPVERKQPQPRAKEVRFPLEAEFWVGNSIFTKWGSI